MVHEIRSAIKRCLLDGSGGVAWIIRRSVRSLSLAGCMVRNGAGKDEMENRRAEQLSDFRLQSVRTSRSDWYACARSLARCTCFSIRACAHVACFFSLPFGKIFLEKLLLIINNRTANDHQYIDLVNATEQISINLSRIPLLGFVAHLH